MVKDRKIKPWQQNRRLKQQPGVPIGCNSVSNSQPSGQDTNIAFNSLPSIHIGEAELPVSLPEQNISKSLPLRTPTSHLETEVSSSKRSGLLPIPVTRKFFPPHWSEDAVEEAIEKGDAFRATLRVNAHNRLEAYCTVDGIPIDVMINGVVAQNRAIEGDTVAVVIDPVACWTKLKGSNVSNAAVPAENTSINPQTREVDSGGHRQHPAPETSDSGASMQASGALRRIVDTVNSHPLKRPTGRVIAIIKKSPRRGTIVGFLDAKKYISVTGEDYLQLLPKDPRFPKMLVNKMDLPESAKDRMNNGDETVQWELIAARIDEWSDESPIPLAHVIHILGRGGEIEPQIAAIMFEHGISVAEFSPESLACLPELPWEIPVKELETRKDFRNMCTFTIDPATAIELDDALSIEMVSDEVFRVGVHITDVSYFVHPESALDTEAQIRSTSVYTLQHKIPMLPSQLSEYCSLLPGHDRLALSVIWDISHTGNIISRWIGRSIIRSCCKLSYDFVQNVISGSVGTDNLNSSISGLPKLDALFKWEDVFRSLKSLYEISVSLRRNRFKDGALWLDSSKLGFLFDEFGTPHESFLYETKESNSLVEEFMLLANRSIAEVTSIAFPDSALLRRHPEPNLRKLREFEAFCNKHGFQLDTSSSGQFHLSLFKIREKLKDDPVLYDILVNYASKPMQPASYFCTGELKGRENEWAHYALSVPLYTHFTSPLRRYPDIIVHRTLCATLDAESAYLNQSRTDSNNAPQSHAGRGSGCFARLLLDKNAVESEEGREALAASALSYGVPESEVLAEVSARCNERKLASRYAEEAVAKMYLWVLLKKKEIIVSEARVLALGPKFMSVYVPKLAMERRINYDDTEGLSVEWLGTTSTLLLDLNFKKHPRMVKSRALEDVAMLVEPSEESDEESTPPAVLPLVLHNLSTIPVALHAIGGDDGPLDIGVRLYICSYFT